MVQVGYCRRVWRRISFSTCTAGALRRLKLRSLANARTDFPISLLFTYLSLFRANWTPVKSSGSNREKPASILGFSTVAVLFEGLNHFYPCILPCYWEERFASELAFPPPSSLRFPASNLKTIASAVLLDRQPFDR